MLLENSINLKYVSSYTNRTLYLCVFERIYERSLINNRLVR